MPSPLPGRQIHTDFYGVISCSSLRIGTTLPASLYRPLSTIHIFLIVYQIAFLISIPLCLLCLVPAALFLTYIALALCFNKLVVTLLLNGPAYRDSKIHIPESESHPEERWIFLNGVSVGSHWLKANIGRLALTFRRPIRGVHNPTDGILFDLVQYLIERNFSYSTRDLREAYVQIKAALCDSQYKKIVLILHSQGGFKEA